MALPHALMDSLRHAGKERSARPLGGQIKTADAAEKGGVGHGHSHNP